MEIKLLEWSDTPHPLGRHVVHDPRSKNFPFAAAGPITHKTVLWGAAKRILNQKQLGGCVGFTGADMGNTDLWKPLRTRAHGGKLYANADGIKFYEAATRADDIPGQYPPNDTGSSGLGLAKALKAMGLISDYTHCFGFNHFLDAIMTQPVAVGTVWTNDMFHPDRSGLLHLGDTSDSNIAGGHEYMVRGADVERKLVRMRNHWTAQWGDSGEADISFDDFATLLNLQGDVTVLHGAGVV